MSFIIIHNKLMFGPTRSLGGVIYLARRFDNLVVFKGLKVARSNYRDLDRKTSLHTLLWCHHMRLIFIITKLDPRNVE